MLSIIVFKRLMNKQYCQSYFFFLIIVIFFFHSTVYSVKPSDFIHFSVEEGLPDLSIKEIFQDHLGFLWFGTVNGLVKYNGYEFHTYKPVYGDSLSLVYGDITSIDEDSQGNIWIGTWGGGICYFERNTGSFHSIKDNLVQLEIVAHKIKKIWIDQNDKIWFVNQYDQLTLYDPIKNDGYTVKHEKQPVEIYSYLFDGIIFYSFFETTSNHIWFSDKQTGLFYYDKDTEEINKISVFENDPVTCIVEDKSDSSYWISVKGQDVYYCKCENKKLIKIDSMSNLFPNFNFKNAYNIFICSNDLLWISLDYQCLVYSLSRDILYSIDIADCDSLQEHHSFIPVNEDLNKNIWAISEKGIYYFRSLIKEDHLHLDYAFEMTLKFEIPTISSCHVDFSNILWVGEMWNGLYKIDPLKQSFNHYKIFAQNSIPGFNNQQPQQIINSICESDYFENCFWLGAGNGLYLFDREQEIFISYLDKIPNFCFDKGSVYSAIESKIKPGVIWFNVSLQGIVRADLVNKKTKCYSYEQLLKNSSMNEFGFNSIINRMIEGRDGSIWIGTNSQGLIKLNPHNDEIELFNSHLADNYFLSSDTVSCIFEDSNCNIWVGTRGGLHLFNKDKNRFENYLEQYKVISLFESSSKQFWVGTYDNGFCCFDRKSGSTIFYSTINGLPSDVTQNIIEDGDHFFWIPTHKGLAKFDPKTKIFENFDKNNGLYSSIFHTGGLISHQGEIFLSIYMGGLVSFFPNASY